MRRAVPIAVLFAACNAAPDPATDVGSDSKVEVVTCAPASNLPQRPVAEHCDDDRPVGNLELRREPWQLDPCSGGPGGVVPDQCRTHDDCRGGMNGRCAGNSETGFLCTYDECFTDSDCGPDEACRCEGGVYSDNNRCVSAGGEDGLCRTNSDCGDSGVCSPSAARHCNPDIPELFACRTCDDECATNDDCVSLLGEPAFCRFDGERWSCAILRGCYCD